MKNKPKGTGIWKYIVTAVVCVAVGISAIIVFVPGIAGSSFKTVDDSIYDSGYPQKLISPASYDELYKVLKKHYKDHNGYEPVHDDMMYIVEESNEKAESAPGRAETFSDTNIRTENVFEADIVKTDGRYIYTVTQDRTFLTIVDTKDTMKTVYSEEIINEYSEVIEELFVKDNYLYLIVSGSSFRDNCTFDATYLRTYDISDPANTHLVREYEQDGSYITSRVVDDHFYLISNYTLSQMAFEKNMPFYPCFNNESVAPEDILYGKNFSYVNYYCFASLDLADSGNIVSAKALINNPGNIYVSENSIFFTSNERVSEKEKKARYDRTNIMKLSYMSGELLPELAADVNGELNDSFSIDEYNGYLRMVLTESGYVYDDTPFIYRIFNNDYNWGERYKYNSLVILDDNLEMISKIDGLASDEDIKSARFYQDSLYFVTYKTVDPLFAADLSDPYKPEITDGIKISGFSDYLHFWSDDMLIGIGFETDEYGTRKGVKVSMFDISDPGNLKEISRIIVDDTAYMTSSNYGYKGVFVDPSKNLIGFALDSYQDDYEYGDYHLLSYDKENGFKTLGDFNAYTFKYNDIIYTEDDAVPYEDTPSGSEASVPNPFPPETPEEPDENSKPVREDAVMIPPMMPDYYYSVCSIKDIRGLYIGDNFYIVHPGNVIRKISLKDYKIVQDLKLYDDSMFDDAENPDTNISER